MMLSFLKNNIMIFIVSTPNKIWSIGKKHSRILYVINIAFPDFEGEGFIDFFLTL